MLHGTRWHTCGQELEVVWKWNGKAYVLYLLGKDGLPQLDNHNCPGCGEYIYENELVHDRAPVSAVGPDVDFR